MLRFQWNALRTGDKVLVHDPRSPTLALTPGAVDSLETRKGANGVGIRVAGEGPKGAILWPSYLAVHSDPRDVAEPCWRCQAIERGADLRPVPAPAERTREPATASDRGGPGGD